MYWISLRTHLLLRSCRSSENALQAMSSASRSAHEQGVLCLPIRLYVKERNGFLPVDWG
jgi:hypothetical protein